MLVADGHTNQEIADRLFTSERTIENYRQTLIEKTEAKNTASLIRYAIQHGLIN
jgi:DNA-binding NarL/FixJ family response regulator